MQQFIVQPAVIQHGEESNPRRHVFVSFASGAAVLRPSQANLRKAKLRRFSSLQIGLPVATEHSGCQISGYTFGGAVQRRTRPIAASCAHRESGCQSHHPRIHPAISPAGHHMEGFSANTVFDACRAGLGGKHRPITPHRPHPGCYVAESSRCRRPSR